MKNILITGVTGLLGSNLAKCLSKYNYNIIGVSRTKNKIYNNNIKEEKK